jgi:hypothetical protein
VRRCSPRETCDALLAAIFCSVDGEPAAVSVAALWRVLLVTSVIRIASKHEPDLVLYCAITCAGVFRDA